MSRFPAALLVEGRRLPGTPETFRRLLRALEIQSGQRVLLVGAGEGLVFRNLASERGAQVTALEWHPQWVAACEARVRDEALTGKVSVRQGDLTAVSEQLFDTVLVETLPPPGPLTPFAAQLRELLTPNGRVGMTLPAAVGLATAEATARFWSEALGMPLARPAALLSLVEQAGFEPQWAEALSDDLMAEHYRLVGEAAAKAEPALAERARAEIEQFKGAGRAGSTFAMLVARRREPGEKPPPARTAG